MNKHGSVVKKAKLNTKGDAYVVGREEYPGLPWSWGKTPRYKGGGRG